jgi:hypothetical protein
MDYQRLIDRADFYIVERSRRVILVFLLLTVVFGVGLGNVTTDAGTSGFSQDIPAERAFQDVNEKFSPAFAQDSGSTQLIQSGNNVLGKPAMLRMLEVQQRAESRTSLRVSSTSSAATIVAQTLDPSRPPTASGPSRGRPSARSTRRFGRPRTGTRGSPGCSRRTSTASVPVRRRPSASSATRFPLASPRGRDRAAPAP